MPPLAEDPTLSRADWFYVVGKCRLSACFMLPLQMKFSPRPGGVYHSSFLVAAHVFSTLLTIPGVALLRAGCSRPRLSCNLMQRSQEAAASCPGSVYKLPVSLGVVYFEIQQALEVIRYFVVLFCCSFGCPLAAE